MSSRNDFNAARKLINDIRADTNRVKPSSSDEKVFNDLNGLINDIQNKKTKRENVIKKIKNIVLDLDQQRQKESTVFQNKMIGVAYYLFNAFGICTKSDRLMLQKWVNVCEKRFKQILSTITEIKTMDQKLTQMK